MTGHIAFDNNGQRFNFTILLTEVSVYKNRLKEVCNLVSTGYTCAYRQLERSIAFVVRHRDGIANANVEGDFLIRFTRAGHP